MRCPQVKQAVHRALDAGLLVCFATGRNFTESRTVLEDVAHYDTAVFVGGAMVPTVFATGFAMFSGKQRAMIPAILGMVSVLAPTLGPTEWLLDCLLFPGDAADQPLFLVQNAATMSA